MIEIFILYGLLGLFAGVLAGLFGIGGGLVIVPALVWIFRSQGFDESIVLHLAIGTSLATIIITAIGSMRAHNKRGSLDWDVFKQLSPGIIVGALLGAWIADQFSTLWLQRYVGAFILLVALQIAFNLSVNPHRGLPAKGPMTAAGSIIGTLSAMIGIGGGTLSVPFMVWHNVPMKRAVGTASACGLPIAIAGTVGFFITGSDAASTLPEYSTGFLYWPAVLGIVVFSYLMTPVGASLAHRLPVQTLKRLFAVVLLAVGIHLLTT